jgi:hypothetical protein
MPLCRNCEHWRDTLQWRGNCSRHPWEHDKYSEEAEPEQNCNGKDFMDKYIKYQQGVKCLNVRT